MHMPKSLQVSRERYGSFKGTKSFSNDLKLIIQLFKRYSSSNGSSVDYMNRQLVVLNAGIKKSLYKKGGWKLWQMNK